VRDDGEGSEEEWGMILTPGSLGTTVTVETAPSLGQPVLVTDNSPACLAQIGRDVVITRPERSPGSQHALPTYRLPHPLFVAR
jgi:hypothetical protein